MSKREAERWLDRIKQQLLADKVKLKTEVITALKPLIAGEIVDYAQEKDVDLVVVGSRGMSGFKRVLLGSVASAVVTYAHCPVLVVTNFLDLRHAKLPIYEPDDSIQNIQEARHLVEWADAFVLASPDYHGSMSGALKNFLDHFWEEFAGKTFSYICASGFHASLNNRSNVPL